MSETISTNNSLNFEEELQKPYCILFIQDHMKTEELCRLTLIKDGKEII